MEHCFHNKPQGTIMPPFTIRLLTAAAILLSVTQTAQAGPYGTVGVSVEDIQPEDDFESFTGTGINARLGYNFGRYFGVEAEGQIGLSGEGDNPRFQDGVLDQNQTYDYRGAWSLYLRPQLPVSEKFTLSARAGFGVKYFDRTTENPFLERLEPIIGMVNPADLFIEDIATLGHGALGVGVEYSFGEQKIDSLRLDVTRRFHIGSLSDGEDEPFQDSQVTVSYGRKF